MRASRIACVVLLLLGAARARPDDQTTPSASAQEPAQDKWGFSSLLGAGGAGGEPPVHEAGVGADAYIFFRDSHYHLVNPAEGIDHSGNVTQRNPQARIYVALSSVR